MGYRWLATGVVVLHATFLAYVVLGGLLTWWWPWTFWPHLLAVGWGLAVVAIPLDCPLTWLENWARRHAGQPVPTRGFIDRYVEGVLYPERYTLLVQILVALFIVGTWLVGLKRWR